MARAEIQMKAKPYLIDSDVLIDYFRNIPQAINFIEDHVGNICFSAITVAEIYTGIRNSTEQAEIDDFFMTFPVLDVNREIAKSAGLFLQ